MIFQLPSGNWQCPSWLDAPQLLSVNQTEFTIEAQPTSHGRTHRTRDMLEVVVCICGVPVETADKTSTTTVQCGYKGCETSWVCWMSFYHSISNSCGSSTLSASTLMFHLEIGVVLITLDLVLESPVFCGFLAIFGTVEAGANKKSCAMKVDV